MSQIRNEKSFILIIHFENGKQRWIKNFTCCYFDDIIRFWDRDIDFSDILLEKKLDNEKYKNILIHNISYRTSTAAKPLHIRFNKIDGLIKIQKKIRYLVLFYIVVLIKFVIKLNIV